MKYWILLPIVALMTACTTAPKSRPVVQPIPAQVSVAVCSATVERKNTDLDRAKVGMRLEEQNTVIRKSLAQLKEYVIELEASFVECGGKIK